MKKILLYNADNKKEEQIRKLCSSLHIPVTIIMPHRYMKPIGALAGIKGIETNGIKNELPVFSDEMMLFVNFDDQSLWDFLARYRQAGIEKIELKAGLTSHNVMWNSVQLRNELKREHDELAQP